MKATGLGWRGGELNSWEGRWRLDVWRMMVSRIRERWSDDKFGRLGALIRGGLQMEFRVSRLLREPEFVNSWIRSSRICEFRA